MSPIPLGILALSGAGGSEYWIANIAQTGGMIYPTTDGCVIGVGGNKTLYKTDLFGKVNATKISTVAETRQVITDTDGSVYLVNLLSGRAQVIKLDSSLNTVWAYYQNLDGGASSHQNFFDAGRPIVTATEIWLPYGYAVNGGNQSQGKLLKISKDGATRNLQTFNWDNSIYTGNDHVMGVALDPITNNYAITAFFTTSIATVRVVRLNSSNAITRTDYVGNGFTGGDIIWNSTLNHFVHATQTNWLVGLTNAGAANLSTKEFSSISGVPKMASDSTGNLYYVNRDSSDNGKFYVIKLDTSYNVVWQRSFSNGSTNGVVVQGIYVANDKIYVSAYAGTDSIYAVLPTDGSGVGSYNFGATTWTYSVSSVTKTNVTRGHNTESTGLTAGSQAVTSISPNLTNTSSLLSVEALA